MISFNIDDINKHNRKCLNSYINFASHVCNKAADMCTNDNMRSNQWLTKARLPLQDCLNSLIPKIKAINKYMYLYSAPQESICINNQHRQ